MLARSKLTRQPRDEVKPTPEASQARPAEERFQLRVDGQSKRSFASLEEAVAVGRKIKNGHPVVVVTVLNSKDGTTRVVQAD